MIEPSDTATSTLAPPPNSDALICMPGIVHVVASVLAMTVIEIALF